jgi:hypothetical protein
LLIVGIVGLSLFHSAIISMNSSEIFVDGSLRPDITPTDFSTPVLVDESAPISNMKKDLTKEIEDDDPDTARHRESIHSNAVFSWKSEDERHFQSEFKKRCLTRPDQIQALCGQNAILQAEVRRLELEKAAFVKRLPLERKHVQFASANDSALIEARNEIQQLREAVAALGIETKLMDSKIKTLEERLAREKLIPEA